MPSLDHQGGDHCDHVVTVAEHLDDQVRAKVLVEDVGEIVEVVLHQQDQLVDEVLDRGEEHSLRPSFNSFLSVYS